MNILFCLGSLRMGGAERVVSNLSNFFSEDHEVTIITTSFTKVPYYKLEKKVAIYALDKENNGENFFLSNLSRIKKLNKMIRKIKPDIVISFSPEQNFRMLFLKKIVNIPVVISERSDPKEMYKKRIFRFAMKRLYPRADGFVFQTKEVRDYFNWIKKIERKSFIIPNPVNEEFFENPYEGMREKKIVSVGRFEEVKNFKMLINAFYEIQKEFEDYKLVIYGEGSLYNKLSNQIKELNLLKNVYLPGKKNHIKKEIEKASLFVLTSNYEGLPNALMEALSLGIPGIATDCASGGPRSLIENGVNGFLIPVNDKEMLIKKMKIVLKNQELKKKMGKNAQNRMKSYCPECIYIKWEQCLEDIVKNY